MAKRNRKNWFTQEALRLLTSLEEASFASETKLAMVETSLKRAYDIGFAQGGGSPSAESPSKSIKNIIQM